MSIKIIIADDHHMIRDGLKSLLEKEQNFDLIGEAANGREITRLTAEMNPDIVLMDVSMPELNGIEATRQIKEHNEDVGIIALSVHSDVSFVRQMLKAGASGYLVKHCEFKELVQAIYAVDKGELYLSPLISGQVIQDYLRNLAENEATVYTKLSDREREILQMLTEGKTKQEIADTLFISVKTIDSHRQNIMNKLGIDTMPALVRYAIRSGITEL